MGSRFWRTTGSSGTTLSPIETMGLYHVFIPPLCTEVDVFVILSRPCSLVVNILVSRWTVVSSRGELWIVGLSSKYQWL